MSTLLHALHERQPLPSWVDAIAASLHPAGKHLDAAELSIRCCRRAYIDDKHHQAAVFVRSAIEDLRAALLALEARQ